MKILITPRSYGKTDSKVFDMLEQAGITYVRNETGGILNKEQMKSLLSDCDGIIVGVDPLDGEIIDHAKKLKVIAKYGVGVDNIDMEKAASRGIKVSRTVGANSDAVADYAMTLMLSLARKVIPIDSACRKADWKKVTTIDVSHKTLGILGFGAIGKLVAKRAQGFDMRILAYDVLWDSDYAKSHDIEKATPDQIYQEADFISVHLPLLPETKNFIDENQIAMMKPTAILINTARGGLINEDALLSALKEKRLYGAGLDVFSEEPPANHEWFALDNIVIGSHCAASTTDAALNMGRMATENIIRDLKL
ncbi:MAG: phosphoglycerate dehydrogenase [Flexilinea sp.]